MDINTNLNPLIIAVDTGNKLIKTVRSNFVAGLMPMVNNLSIPSTDPYDTIRYNGQSYAVSLERTKWERDKTRNSTYLLLTLMAIAKELNARCPGHRQDAALDMILSVGLPPGHLQDESIVASFKNYFLANGGVYRYLCGGVEHHIAIRDVVVCPQGYSVLLTLDEATIRKPSLYLIDIGGGTSDTVHLEHGRNDNNLISLDMGVIPMYATIQTQMDSKFGRKITETQIDDILLHGVFDYFKQDHINFVFAEAERHVQRLLARHKDLGADLKSSFVVFLGGGAILLEKQIKRIAGDATGGMLVLRNIHANAEGFEIFTRTKLRLHECEQ